MRRNQKRTIGNVQFGVIALVLALLVCYFGFTKAVPFRHHYTVTAMFKTASTLKTGTFVRIAGVNVGKVTEIKLLHPGDPAVAVKMRLEKKALPLHSDATFKLRPRIFLEGNEFVDIQPGTPSAPTTGDGHVFPVNQTATPVQIDQILGALPSYTRKDLQSVLRELSSGLGHGGARGYNRSIPYWAPAYRDGSMVSDATLGEEAHDLSNYIAHSQKVADALDREPARLQSLIVDLNTTAHALGVHDVQLRDAINELPRTLAAGLPALRELNNAFPPVRRFVASWRPPTRSSGPAIDATIPLAQQLRGLVSRPELRGLVGDLRPTVPDLARLNKTTVPLYQQVSLASNCQNDVILPWSHDKIQDVAFPAVGPVYQESVKGLTGLSGESRSGDANGQWFRVLLTGGQYAYPQGNGQFLFNGRPIEGADPPLPPSRTRPPLRPDVPCETQQAPDLRTIPGPPPSGGQRVQGSNSPDAVAYRKKAMDDAVKWLRHQLLVTGNASQMKVSDKPITTGNAKSIPGLGKFGHFKVPDMKPTTKIVKAKDLKSREGKR
jgi:phospholipid/cholesterol/gamma-HCH transport system substrate-binding protein